MTKVIIYTSNTCHYCHEAKDYLKERGIAFEERNISTDKTARTELMQRGVRGVPALLIDGELIVGFRPEKIEKLLDYIIADCPNCRTGLRIPKNKGAIKVTCPKCKEEFKTRS